MKYAVFFSFSRITFFFLGDCGGLKISLDFYCSYFAFFAEIIILITFISLTFLHYGRTKKEIHKAYRPRSEKDIGNIF